MVSQDNLKKVRKFENSQLVFDIYSHLSKCRHVLRQKCKELEMNGRIQVDNLVQVLEDMMPLEGMNKVKWRIIANLGDKWKDGKIEIDYFMRIIKQIGERASKHPNI